MKNSKFKIIFKRTVLILLSLCIIGVLSVVSINLYMIYSVKDYIHSKNELANQKVDCVLVLGAGLWDGEPSPMLRERLDFGIEAYNTGCSDRMLMSGDHGREEYDEVNKMKECAVEDGVPGDNVFMDHAGFSTYESMYRAKEVFEVESAVIVTQKYHLYRAVYNARRLGIDAYGYAADELNYPIYNDVREALARTKDFFWCIFKPEPTYLGDAIPISGSGAQTDDKVLV